MSILSEPLIAVGRAQQDFYAIPPIPTYPTMPGWALQKYSPTTLMMNNNALLLHTQSQPMITPCEST